MSPSEPATSLSDLSLTTHGDAFGENESYVASADAVLVHKHVSEGAMGGPGGEWAYQLYSADSSDPVTLQLGDTADSTLISEAVGLQQDPDADQVVVWVTHIHRKANGLTGSSGSLQLHVFNPDGSEKGTVTAAHHVSGDSLDDESSGVMDSTVVGTTAVIATDFEEQHEVFGVDVATGRQLWDKKCGERSGGLVGGPGIVAFQCGDSVVGIDPSSGATTWSVSSDDDALSTDSGMGGLDGATSIPVADHVAVSGAGGNAYGILDLKNGKIVWGTAALIDSAAELGVVDFGETDGPGPTLEVDDLKTGTTVFTLSAQQRSSLEGLTVLGAYDGRLWIWTDDGLDVVDARSGAPDALAPAKVDGLQQSTNIPTAAGRTWVLLSNTDGNGDPEPTTLFQDPSGDIRAEDLPPSEITGLGG